VSGIAADSQSRAVVATTDANNAVVLGLDAAGAMRWSYETSNTRAIAVDALDHVVITGQGPRLSVLDANGSLLFEQKLQNGWGDGLATMKDGTIVMKGLFGETIDFGAGPLVAESNTSAVFVAAFAPEP
jgi:hypothetical protein